jgi:hypothetical protein
MSVETFDPDTVNHFVLRKQHLANGPVPASIIEVTRHIGGLHNTGPSTPYLSLFARVPGFARGMLDEELYLRKSLVRIRCMRNTMHILPRDLVPAAFNATKRLTGQNAGRFLQYRGVTPGEYERASREIVDLLTSGGRAIVEIKKVIRPVASLPAVLTLMCDRGILARGETPGWRSNAYTYHLFSEYLPDLSLDGVTESEATVQLVRQYFEAFGPSTPDDAAWWTGLGRTKVLQALKYLPVDHIKISDIDGDFLLLHGDSGELRKFRPASRTTVNFLPWLDPFIMGYKNRDRYLPRESYNYVFDRSGNSTNTIIVNGIISGVWDYVEEEMPLVRYFLFGNAREAPAKQIIEKAKAIGRFISGRQVRVEECRSMTPLTQRPAGSMMSPLKGQ